MMTDKELLELAAKAADYKYQWFGANFHVSVDEVTWQHWSPLTDNGDALRLAAKLHIDIDWSHETSVQTYSRIGEIDAGIMTVSEELLEGDPYAATRRAIVRAAAEIGKAGEQK